MCSLLASYYKGSRLYRPCAIPMKICCNFLFIYDVLPGYLYTKYLVQKTLLTQFW